MKLNDDMRYPHPVLSEFSNDYVTGEISADFSHSLTDEGQVKVVSEIQINAEILRNLISEQKADVGYFLVCRRTYFNQLERVPAGSAESYFPSSELYGTIIIRPVVWSLEEIPEFSSPIFNPEFGNSTHVLKGSILALGPELKFSIDPQKFKPFETIFELKQNDDVAAGEISVDPDGDRISILAEEETYQNIARIRAISHGQDMLLNSVYLPAVMEVIAALQAGHTALTSRRWFRIFEARCGDLGFDPTDTKMTPLAAAQKLLRQPFKLVVRTVESFG